MSQPAACGCRHVSAQRSSWQLISIDITEHKFEMNRSRDTPLGAITDCISKTPNCHSSHGLQLLTPYPLPGIDQGEIWNSRAHYDLLFPDIKIYIARYIALPL